MAGDRRSSRQNGDSEVKALYEGCRNPELDQAADGIWARCVVLGCPVVKVGYIRLAFKGFAVLNNFPGHAWKRDGGRPRNQPEVAILRRVVPAERRKSGHDKREPGYHEGDSAFQVGATLQLQLFRLVSPIFAMLLLVQPDAGGFALIFIV
jgi:hypothetical protein